VIELPLEAGPQMCRLVASDGETVRLHDWLNSQPSLAALVNHALEVWRAWQSQEAA
jgi:hypothetical protein